MGIIGAPLGAQIRAGGRLVGIVVSLMIFLVYYLLLVGARSIGETGFLSPAVGVLASCPLPAQCMPLSHEVVRERKAHGFLRTTLAGEEITPSP